ncbi:NeuD/PglB/VioB family sugar acetyltransferase [Pseudoalteromonas rubra]|uniref:Pilus assembly protein n=1 Tax=Pseudoalteromonas rubra TaxID=43658 RepID=A0A0U2Z605_9GAMM|nr:NeuD/PglB/VioB family sugar acetyltransferase [Pseudoalteromonas rubra]ALU43233.1 pilus assembly protein [Pseudoalteromonas rubra]
MNKVPVVLIGGGGHAAGLAEILTQQNRQILAVVAPELSPSLRQLAEFTHHSNDEDVLNYDKHQVELVNGIGAMPYKSLRQKIYKRFKKDGYKFAQVIANSANISANVRLAEGVQIMQNAVVCIGSSVGENSIVNTSSTIDHDCSIGMHCHIAPGVTMSGQVRIEDGVHVATGASIINNITIGENAIVGVGASLTKSLAKNCIAYGPKTTVKVQGAK